MTFEIVKTPEVLHGKPRFEGTRIGVIMIARMIREGEYDVDSVLEGYPDLSREQVKMALDYYDDHPELVEVMAAQREANIQAIDRENPEPNRE